MTCRQAVTATRVRQGNCRCHGVPADKGTTELDAERALRRRAIATRFCGIAASFSSIFGIAALVGWATGVEALKRVLPGMVAMNPMTAILFFLAGLSLWGQRADVMPGRQRAARWLAAIVLLVATLKLIALFTHWNAGVDSLLFADQLVDGITQSPNRMAPNTAANFFLAGLGLLLLDRTTTRGWRPTEVLAAVVGMVSLLALLGYLYRIGPMYGISRFIPMALHTAIGFLLLAMGLFCARPHQGWMGVFTGIEIGGAMARLMLPGMLVLLVVIGWLRVEAENRGIVDFQLGVTLHTSTFILMASALIALGALSLNRAGEAQLRAVQQREQAVAEQQRSQARTLSIIETARDAFISIDASGHVTEWNAAAETMFGWTRNQALGRDLSDIIIPEQHQQAHRDALERLARSGVASMSSRRIEITARRRRGTEFPVELSIWPQAAQDSPGFNAFVRDITESRQAQIEIRDLNADLVNKAIQLEQSNQELGSFSYSISHDLRAPLRHIDGYARILQEDAAPQLDSEARRYLDEIGAAARRMGNLIDDLLAFSRLGRQPVERITVPMHPLLDQVLQEHCGGPDSRIEIGPLPDAYGDPALLKQVWVNLLSNALKYSAPRGAAARITISGEREGDMLRYTIADNGVGFDMQYADKLFGVFRRLHSQDEFEGTGVGLAIVQRLVSRHGGTVSASAKLNLGATFTFELPASPANSAMPRIAEHSE